MYNTYAQRARQCRKDGTLCQKHIVSSNHGHRENELSQKDIARTGCEARGLVLTGRGFGQCHYYTNGIAGRCTPTAVRRGRCRCDLLLRL